MAQLYTIQKNNHKSIRIVYLFLFTLVVAIYAATLSNGFSYDDIFVIVNNQSALNFSNIKDLFTVEYFNISKEGSYRPLVTLSYFWDQFIGGGDPFLYHLSNLLFHAINALLVLNLFVILSNNRVTNTAIIAASIYTIHPALSEAVNSIGFREDLICTLFALLSVISYAKGRLSLSQLALGMALLSKEMAIMTPFLFLIYDRLYKQRLELKKYIGFIVLAISYLIIRFFILYNPLEEAGATPIPLDGKFMALPMAILYYIRLLFFPISLSADYAPYAFLTTPSFYSLTLANLLFLGAVVFLINGRQNFNPLMKFGLYWFFVTLIPVLNIFEIGNPFAERYLYFPAIGFVLFAVSLFFNHVTLKKKISIIFLLAAIFSFFAILNQLRNPVWKNEYTLWQDTMKKAPFSFRPYSQLATIAYMNKDYDKAIFLLKRAIEVKPDFFLLYINLGVQYLNKEDYEKTLSAFIQADKLSPGNGLVQSNMAILYHRMGNFEMARKAYLKTIEIEPDNPSNHFNIAMLLSAEGFIKDAIVELETAIKLGPSLPEAHYYLGTLYEKNKNYSKAVGEFIAELGVNPSYYKARLGLSRIFINYGLSERARAELKEILKVAPGNTEAIEYLKYLTRPSEESIKTID